MNTQIIYFDNEREIVLKEKAMYFEELIFDDKGNVIKRVYGEINK